MNDFVLPNAPELKYAILPWYDQISAGYIVSTAGGLLIAYCIFEAIFKRYNKSMRRGTLALIGNTVWPLLINIGIFSVAYWQWALPLTAATAVLFLFVIRHELKEAYTEEKEGYRGLNPLIREVRAEIFADLSIEEQMAYKAQVKPQKVYWWIWLPLMIAIPFLVMLLAEAIGVGDYLFQVVYYPQA